MRLLSGPFPRLLVGVVLAFLLACPAVSISACGDDPAEPAVQQVTASPTADAGQPTAYKAERWGFSLTYDAGDFRLESTESTSSLPLSPSLLTGRELQLKGLKTLDVNLTRTDADRSAARLLERRRGSRSCTPCAPCPAR
jgi:hypothetical protein